jgi:hypothetical protein
MPSPRIHSLQALPAVPASPTATSASYPTAHAWNPHTHVFSPILSGSSPHALIVALSEDSSVLSLYPAVPASPTATSASYPTAHAWNPRTQLLYHNFRFPPTHPYFSPTFFTGQHKCNPFQGHPVYPGLVSYWFARLCGWVNGNWQVVLALLLVHWVLRASQRKLTVWFPLSPCVLYNPKLRQAIFSAHSLLQAGSFFDIIFDLEDGVKFLLRNVGRLSIDCTALIPEDRTIPNYRFKNLKSYYGQISPVHN